MKKTNWYVVTGQPCSGKTAVIDALAALGYKISEEVARKYYLQLMVYHTQEELLENALTVQQQILDKELSRESKLNPDELIFFDRALPDSLAYYRELGDVPALALDATKHFRYQEVFYLEPLPFEQDAVRHEEADVANRLGRFIYEAYTQLGYDVVRVPAVSIKERVDLILSYL